MRHFNCYYFIKEAAEMTGLSEQLIRKWEKRYHLIQPKRLDNGYRVYTLEDLVILKQLKELREQGQPMKQAIQTVLKKRKSEHHNRVPNTIKKSPHVDKMIAKGEAYDEAGLFSILKQAHYKYGLDLFLQNTVQPFIEEINQKQEQSEWNESQEAISYLVVRDFLTQISRNLTCGTHSPYALGVCLPYELHEIPLQIILLQMNIRGWRTTHIETFPNLPAIENMIDQLQPKKVIMSASTAISFQKNEKLLEELDQIAKTHSSIEFYIGGRAAWNYTEIIKPYFTNVFFTVDDILK